MPRRTLTLPELTPEDWIILRLMRMACKHKDIVQSSDYSRICTHTLQRLGWGTFDQAVSLLENEKKERTQ